MRIEYENTYADYAAFVRVRRRRGWFVAMRVAVWGAFVLLSLSVGVAGYRSGTPRGWWVLPLLCLATMVATPLLNAAQLRLAWRRATAGRPQHVDTDVGDGGILINGDGVRTFIEWRAFTHYRETRDLFLLFQGPGNAGYLPKRVLGDAERVSEFRAWLEARIGRTRYVPEPTGFPVKV